VPIIGLTSTGLALLIGGVLLRWRRSSPRLKQTALAVPDPFTHGSATEKRASFRRMGNPVKVLVSDEEARARPTEGWVMDRSVGGLCLSVPHEMSNNTILSVRTVSAPTEIPWVRVQVKRCRPLEGHWELGCEFVRTPTWSVLLLFG
jgi:hypothetical protein